MSIRFKFRSSVNFDTIEIDGGKPYISVGELRSKILCQKKLNSTCHKDFDLVFFDALTGQEYNDYEFKIPSGSSVIVKRVPAEPVPSAMLRHHKLEESELSEDIPKGKDPNKPVEIVLEKKLAPELGEHIKLEKVANAKGIDLQKVDLPPELRCPICNTYFKEAVMIPCCQHSFCKKCVCEILPRMARCPKCSSTKFGVEQLLPNLSLRHAIEHFLESQILDATPENDMQKYVPDGESGIQGQEVSTITKRKLDLLNSTSATEKGSTPLLNVNNSNGGRDTHEDLALFAYSQGENQPLMPQVCMPDEADSISRKRGSWVNFRGGDRSFAVGNRNTKVDRTCYMCGSPGHFVRDCPIASAQHPMFHTGDPVFQGGMAGYAMPYWNPAAFPSVNPYMNMYGSPGMVPFNATMVPYGVPPYVPSTYGSLPVASGVTRMGAPELVGARDELPLRRSENLELQNSDNRVNYSHEKRKRPYDYKDDVCRKRHDCHELERSSDYRGKALSNSEESHGRKSQREHHRDKHLNKKTQFVHERHEKRSHSTNDGRDHTDRSISGIEDVHSGNNRHDEAKHKHYYQNSRKHHDNRDQSGSDCSRTHHQIKKERDVKRTNSEFEPSYSRDQKKLHKDVTHRHGVRENSYRK